MAMGQINSAHTMTKAHQRGRRRLKINKLRNKNSVSATLSQGIGGDDGTDDIENPTSTAEAKGQTMPATTGQQEQAR